MPCSDTAEQYPLLEESSDSFLLVLFLVSQGQTVVSFAEKPRWSAADLNSTTFAFKTTSTLKCVCVCVCVRGYYDSL